MIKEFKSRIWYKNKSDDATVKYQTPNCTYCTLIWLLSSSHIIFHTFLIFDNETYNWNSFGSKLHSSKSESIMKILNNMHSKEVKLPRYFYHGLVCSPDLSDRFAIQNVTIFTVQPLIYFGKNLKILKLIVVIVHNWNINEYFIFQSL